MMLTGPTYIYAGEGAWNISIDQTESMLKSYLDERSIKRINSLEDIPPESQLIVIPGGFVPFMSISPKKIKAFVSEGGRFLGICAGGILASSHILARPKRLAGNKSAFSSLPEGNTFYEDHGPTEGLIGLCNKSIAPFIVNNPNPQDAKNLCAVNVYSPEQPNAVYKSLHYSGPAFFDSQDSHTKVLLRYQNSLDLLNVKRTYPNSTLKFELTGEKVFVENPIAALSLSYGSGFAVLTGIHPEMNSTTFPKNEGFEFPSELTGYETQRQTFIDTIFKELNIKKAK